MQSSGEPTVTPSPRLVETMARLFRHEVGDLLQTVYAAVAILQERLGPDLTLERRLLGDLRWRAEVCRNELDAIHDLVCPLTLTPAPLDLAELASGQVAAAARRFPNLQVRLDATGPAPVLGDAQRLALVGNLLLVAACQVAQQEVRVRVHQTATPEVEWSIRNDGPPANAEQLGWLTAPFGTTHHALAGLGLALAGRLAALHGGRAEAGNGPHGGPEVRLFLPASRAGA
jgi:signal transduction histidine kinase